MKLNSLKFKIPFFISVLAFFCVLLTGIILQVTFINRFEQSIEEKNMIISEMASNELELYLKNATDTAITAANFSTQSDGDLNEIEKEIFRMYDNFDYFDLIFFMNSNAKMVFAKPSNDKVQDRVYTDRDYYWEIIKDKKDYSLSKLLVSSVLKKLHFIIAAPVKNNDGNLIGLIGAGIPLDNVEKILDDFEEGFNGRIWIADETGSIVIHSSVLKTEEIIKISELDIELIDNDMTLEEVQKSGVSQHIKYTIDGNEYFGAVTFVKDANWLVVVEQDMKTINREVYEAISNLIIIQVVVLITALIIGLIIANWLTSPIQQLLKQVRILPQGLKNNEKHSIIAIEDQSDEITELSEAFVIMATQLEKNMSNLESSYRRENRIQQYLNNILTSVHSGIIVADANNVITIINEQAKNITKLTKDIALPTNLFDLLNLLEMNIHDEINQVISKETNFSEVEASLTPIGRKPIRISFTCSPVKNSKLETLGIVLQFRDITRIKEIEEELRKEDRINTMGELSASIIHDIGNPLAGMSNLLEVVKDPGISEDAKVKALEILSDEVNDLNVLVINFLDFVKSGDLERKPTDLIKILEDCIALFSRDISKKNIELIKNWEMKHIVIPIKGRSIKQAIINIYKNAIEAVDTGGRISISVLEKDTTVEIIIQDDGEGMTDQEKMKLYDPFFTTKPEGIGLGLAIAYNAIKESKARLLLETSIGNGAKFTIIFEKDII